MINHFKVAESPSLIGGIHYDGSKVKKTGKHKEITYGTLRLIRIGVTAPVGGLFKDNSSSTPLVPVFQFTDSETAMNTVQGVDKDTALPPEIINFQLTELSRAVVFGDRGEVLGKVKYTFGTYHFVF